jgi:hypothetical protein
MSLLSSTGSTSRKTARVISYGNKTR